MSVSGFGDWDAKQEDFLIRMVYEHKANIGIRGIWKFLHPLFEHHFPYVVRSLDDLRDQFMWLRCNRKRIEAALVGTAFVYEAGGANIDTNSQTARSTLSCIPSTHSEHDLPAKHDVDPAVVNSSTTLAVTLPRPPIANAVVKPAETRVTPVAGHRDLNVIANFLNVPLHAPVRPPPIRHSPNNSSSPVGKLLQTSITSQIATRELKAPPPQERARISSEVVKEAANNADRSFSDIAMSTQLVSLDAPSMSTLSNYPVVVPQQPVTSGSTARSTTFASPPASFVPNPLYRGGISFSDAALAQVGHIHVDRRTLTSVSVSLRNTSGGSMHRLNSITNNGAPGAGGTASVAAESLVGEKNLEVSLVKPVVVAPSSVSLSNLVCESPPLSIPPHVRSQPVSLIAVPLSVPLSNSLSQSPSMDSLPPASSLITVDTSTSAVSTSTDIDVTQVFSASTNTVLPDIVDLTVSISPARDPKSDLASISKLCNGPSQDDDLTETKHAKKRCKTTATTHLLRHDGDAVMGVIVAGEPNIRSSRIRKTPAEAEAIQRESQRVQSLPELSSPSEAGSGESMLDMLSSAAVLADEESQFYISSETCSVYDTYPTQAEETHLTQPKKRHANLIELKSSAKSASAPPAKKLKAASHPIPPLPPHPRVAYKLETGPSTPIMLSNEDKYLIGILDGVRVGANRKIPASQLPSIAARYARLFRPVPEQALRTQFSELHERFFRGIDASELVHVDGSVSESNVNENRFNFTWEMKTWLNTEARNRLQASGTNWPLRARQWVLVEQEFNRVFRARVHKRVLMGVFNALVPGGPTPKLQYNSDVPVHLQMRARSRILESDSKIQSRQYVYCYTNALGDPGAPTVASTSYSNGSSDSAADCNIRLGTMHLVNQFCARCVCSNCQQVTRRFGHPTTKLPCSPPLHSSTTSNVSPTTKTPQMNASVQQVIQNQPTSQQMTAATHILPQQCQQRLSNGLPLVSGNSH